MIALDFDHIGLWLMVEFVVTDLFLIEVGFNQQANCKKMKYVSPVLWTQVAMRELTPWKHVLAPLRVNIIQHIMIKHFYASCIAMLKDINDLNDMMCMLFLKDILCFRLIKHFQLLKCLWYQSIDTPVVFNHHPYPLSFQHLNSIQFNSIQFNSINI